MRKRGDYVRFNEFTDAICSVQLVADLVQPVERRPLLWKWIVIGAHNALQGAMVCALSGQKIEHRVLHLAVVRAESEAPA
jgi:hypothetical protein